MSIASKFDQNFQLSGNEKSQQRELEKFGDLLCYLKLHSKKLKGNRIKVKSQDIQDFYHRLESYSQMSRCVNFKKPIIHPELPTSLFEKVEKSAKNALNNTKLKKPYFDLFTLLNRSYDENLYSDFISLYLNSKRYGDFSKNFIKSLFSYCGLEPEELDVSYITSRREVYLGEFDGRTSDDSGMRIDILITTPSHNIIIETKTKTFEHGSQTVKYFKTLEKYHNKIRSKKKLVGVMLSIEGQKADHSDYKILTFYNLLLALDSAVGKTKEIPLLHKNEISVFYSELYQRLIKPENLAFNRSKNYRLKKYGENNDTKKA